MRLKPKQTNYRIANVVDVYRELAENSRGVLNASTNGKSVTFGISNTSDVPNVVPATQYYIETKDRRSGKTNSKTGTFETTEEIPAGNCLNYTKLLTDKDTVMRISGTVYNAVDNSILYWFNAHTDAEGWSVQLFDFLDSGTLCGEL